MMKDIVIRRCVVVVAGVLLVSAASAQYIPSMAPGSKAKVVEKANWWHPGNMFAHLDLALSIGNSGIGLEVASPICEFAQVRLGYDYMPHFKKHFTSELQAGTNKTKQYDENRNRIEGPYQKVRNLMYDLTGYDMKESIDLTGRLTMNNFKLLVDIFPLSGNKKLHATVGFYWGPSQYGEIESDGSASATLACVNAYNKIYSDPADPHYASVEGYGYIGVPMGTLPAKTTRADDAANAEGDAKPADNLYLMKPGADGRIFIPIKTNAFKPYLGVGYTADLLKKRDDIKFGVTAGLMFWGGTPSMVTPDGVDLTRDVSVSGTAGYNSSLVSKLKAYPTISVRIIKNIF